MRGENAEIQKIQEVYFRPLKIVYNDRFSLGYIYHRFAWEKCCTGVLVTYRGITIEVCKYLGYLAGKYETLLSS